MPTGPLSLISVVGARPQFIKLAPLCRALSELGGNLRHVIVHTGQHYDYGMSEVFFKEMNIPHPDVNLSIGSGRQGEQTAAMIAALELQFESLLPDGVIVYGDTNSTLAGAIVASKLHIPQFHVEAGLRSFDRRMPEEVNRIVADQLAELLLAPTAQAMQNLANEGLAERATWVGDVMYDAVLYNADIARQTSNVLADLNIASGQYAVATIHRAASTDRIVLAGLLETLAGIADELLPVVFPMHPRTRSVLGEAYSSPSKRLSIVEPQPYLDMLALVQNAQLVLTDSGGLQKEAAFLGTPCVTLRSTTEWTETIDIGANRLTGFERDKIRSAVQEILATESKDWSQEMPRLYGDGNAARKIVAVVMEWFRNGRGSYGYVGEPPVIQPVQIQFSKG